MVLIQVTNNPSDEFIVSMVGTSTVEQVTAEIVEINNLRNMARRLVAGMKELALYGVMREEELRGLTVSQIQSSGLKSNCMLTDMDPHGLRVGVPPNEQLSNTLQSCANDQNIAIVQNGRIPQEKGKILDAVNKCRGSTMMAYPMGLPIYDTVYMALYNEEQLDNTQEGKLDFHVNNAQLWFVGKKMTGTDELKKYSGSAEKTLIKVKVTTENATAPQRENGVDAQTQKKMMEFWHKKQREQKELAEAEDDSYMNSSWANPRGLKESTQGLNNIRFR